MRLVDFDSLIYLKFEHSPGYAQWYVMLNLGQNSHSTKGDESALVIERFGNREEAERIMSLPEHGGSKWCAIALLAKESA